MARPIGAALRTLTGTLEIQFLASQLFDPLREMAVCLLAMTALGFIRRAEVRLSFERFSTRE